MQVLRHLTAFIDWSQIDEPEEICIGGFFRTGVALPIAPLANADVLSFFSGTSPIRIAYIMMQIQAGGAGQNNNFRVLANDGVLDEFYGFWPNRDLTPQIRKLNILLPKLSNIRFNFENLDGVSAINVSLAVTGWRERE